MLSLGSIKHDLTVPISQNSDLVERQLKTNQPITLFCD